MATLAGDHAGITKILDIIVLAGLARAEGIFLAVAAVGLFCDHRFETLTFEVDVVSPLLAVFFEDVVDALVPWLVDLRVGVVQDVFGVRLFVVHQGGGERQAGEGLDRLLHGLVEWQLLG